MASQRNVDARDLTPVVFRRYGAGAMPCALASMRHNWLRYRLFSWIGGGACTQLEFRSSAQGLTLVPPAEADLKK
jgi:hypothetical protein